MSEAATSADPSPRPTKKSKQAITSTGSSTGSAHTVAPHLHDAPFQPLPTLRSFYAKDTVSSCPCFLHNGARILIVGDGDLSYSVGLVKHLIGEEHAAAQRDESQVFNNCLSEQQTLEYRRRNQNSVGQSAESTATSTPAFPSSLLQMTCTTYESIEALSARYNEAASNADWLRSQGVRVLHGVDARLIHTRHDLIPLATARTLNIPQDQLARLSDASYLPTTESSINVPCKFHHIIFHFPHVGGKSRIHLNRALLADFFMSANQCIVKKGEQALPRPSASSSSSAATAAVTNPEPEIAGGCIQVSLIRGQGGSPCDTHHRPNYGDHWQLLENGASANLTLIHAFPFTDGLYAGYNNRGFRSRDEEFFWRGVAITHVLTAAEVAGQSLSSDVESEANRLLQSVEAESNAGMVEVRAKMLQELCGVPHHPMQQLSVAMNDLFINDARNDSDQVTQQLSALGWKLLPAGVVTPIDSSLSSAGNIIHLVRPALILSMKCSEEEGQRSPSYVGEVVEVGHTIDTLQWNLEPLLSVAADMEKQIVQPIAVQLASNPSTEASAATTYIPTSAAPVIPLMAGGINVRHHQLQVQLIVPNSDQKPSEDQVALDAVLEKDCITSAHRLLSNLFPEAESFAVRIQLRSSSSSSLSSSSTSSSAAFPLNLEAQVLYQHVWHVVGHGGVVKWRDYTAWAWDWSLTKLCMIRFRIHDLRMLWSEDQRFLSQFASPSTSSGDNTEMAPAPRAWKAFVPFSVHPLCYVRDNSFWMNTATATDDTATSSPPSEFPHARAKELTALYSSLVSLVFGSGICCQIRMTDSFMHPKRGPAIRFRCLYQSVDRALSPLRVLFLQQVLHRMFVKQGEVEMR